MNYTKGEWKSEALDEILIDEILIMGNETTCVAKIVKTYCPECQEANANLIAAAPEMYEALKEMLKYFNERGIAPLYTWRQALAKAEGKTNGCQGNQATNQPPHSSPEG